MLSVKVVCGVAAIACFLIKDSGRIPGAWHDEYRFAFVVASVLF